MTDADIDALGVRYAAGERTPELLDSMTRAMRQVELGKADPGFGRDLQAAIDSLRAVGDAWRGVPLGLLSALADEAGFDPTDCC